MLSITYDWPMTSIKRSRKGAWSGWIRRLASSMGRNSAWSISHAAGAGVRPLRGPRRRTVHAFAALLIGDRRKGNERTGRDCRLLDRLAPSRRLEGVFAFFGKALGDSHAARRL